MGHRRALVIMLLALSSGCGFDDTAPPDAVIVCSANSDCPTGWTCSVLRRICQQRDPGDLVAPVLTGAVSPSLVRPGESVEISLESNEPLSGDAVVEVTSGTSTDVVPGGSGRWTYAVPVREPDGQLIFYARAEDRSGNGSQGVRLGATLVDGTAPRVMLVRVTPETVSPGQLALVTATLSEEVRADAVLQVVTSSGAEVVRASQVNASSVLRFELTVPAGTADQMLELRLSGLFDLAGNAGDDATIGALVVDGTPPVIAPLSLGGRRYSAQSGFDVVDVPVVVSGATSIAACLDQVCQSVADGQRVTFRLTGSEPEGAHTVLVRARDEVGNLAQVADVVTFDFSGPRAQSLIVTPSTVGPGGAVAVTASFDELLAADTTLRVSADDGSWSDQLTSATTGSRLATFDVRLPLASLASGTFHLTLSGAIDDVANATAALDAGLFRLDAEPPRFLAADAGYPHRYSAQAGFNVLTVPTPNVSGASVVQVCLDADCRALDGGTVAFAVTTDAGEGGHALLFRAFDEVGNVSTAFDTVTFDFTAPSVLASNVDYQPAAGCPLLAVTALSQLASITLDVATNEPLASSPMPTAAPLTFTQTPGDGGLQNFSFKAIGPSSGLTSGTLAVNAMLADDVGNTASRVVGQIAVDINAPAALSPAQEDGFVYSRSPNGTQSNSYQPRFQVRADAGVFEPFASVQLWSASSGGNLLGTVRADSTGALPLTSLPPVDYPKLYYRAYDSACNVQPSGAAAPVPRLELTATLFGKVAGSTIPNVHRFFEEYAVDPTQPVLNASREWGTLEVGQVDSRGALSRSPAVHWQTAGIGNADVRCAWQDPVTGNVYALGSRVTRVESKGAYDEGTLPGPIIGNCLTAPAFDSTPRLLAASYAGFITRERGTFMLGNFGYSGGFAGFTTWDGKLLYSLDASPYGTAVHTLEPNYGTWTRLSVVDDLPPLSLSWRNFTHWGDGLPLVVGYNTETWALQADYQPGQYSWVRLDNLPDGPMAVQGYRQRVVAVGNSRAAWELQMNGSWAPADPCPMQATIIASFESIDGRAVFLGADWSLVAWEGTKWTWLSRPPALGGYRTLGHSSQLGTLASLGEDGLLFHTALSDGGLDTTFVWDAGVSGWTRVGGSLDSPSAVAGTANDGTVTMLGRGTDGGMQTWRWLDGGWQLPTTSNAPTARVEHRLVPSQSWSMLLVGGTSLTTGTLASPSLSTFSSNVWNHYNLPWAQRTRAAVAYDKARQLTVVFGGNNGSLLQDTWELGAGTTAAQAVTPVAPPARENASLSYDRVRQGSVLVGGSARLDTWFYDGAWRDLTASVGELPEGVTLSAWDGAQGGVVALGVKQDSVLAPIRSVVAHRFLVTDGIDGGASVLGGSVRASVNSTLAPQYVLWDGSRWVVLGPASLSPTTLDAAAATNALGNGVRIAPASLDAGAMTTDYIELFTRYRITN